MRSRNAKAQFSLGKMYYEGQGVHQDYAEAARWYLKAAEQGYPAAQNNLGTMYAKGQGVRQDYTQAVQWCRRAAEQGHAGAQFNLGVMYAEDAACAKTLRSLKNGLVRLVKTDDQDGCDIYQRLKAGH